MKCSTFKETVSDLKDRETTKQSGDILAYFKMPTKDAKKSEYPFLAEETIFNEDIFGEEESEKGNSSLRRSERLLSRVNQHTFYIGDDSSSCS